MQTRIITGIIGIIGVVACIFISRWLVLIGALFLIATMVSEITRMRSRVLPKTGLNTSVLSFISLIAALSYLACYCAGFEKWAEIGLATNFFVLVLAAVAFYPRLPLETLPVILFDGIYIGWTITHMMVIRDWQLGSYLLLFLFVIIWSSDSGAYFTGRFLGRHHLAPKLSPKKTIEGAVGGILTAIVFGCIMNAFIGAFSFKSVIIMAVVLAIIGIFGDLFESYIKRSCGVKDSGNILPGHGGIMDRFDSFMLALPFATFMMQWM